MTFSPDNLIFFRLGPMPINATLVFTWATMALLVAGSWGMTRRLSKSTDIPRWQHLLEVVILTIQKQIREVSLQEPGIYLPFVGTLFLFVASCSLLSVVPGYQPPTASLLTTAALATCVFFAVPLYGIAQQGFGQYLKQYLKPSPFMLPFNMIGELSRTLALAVRLYGNMMSGSVMAAILVGFVPLFVPLIMNLFGLLTGLIQAYIFAILAMVYIASATATRQNTSETRSLEASPHE
jgi:F-type H+-transporting ATPase subunit a